MSEGEWKFLSRAIVFIAMVILCGGLLLPSGGHGPEPYRRAQTLNNLKIIAFAYQNETYSDPHGRVPRAAVVDPNGKPLLSWRVLLLPLLEEQELFEQFDLSKPWDSPENLPLVKKMPQIFASPYLRDAAKQGKTPYKAIVSDTPDLNTAWSKPGERFRISKFKDGMSHTALIVEDLTDPVIWTKPEDISPTEYLKTLDHGHWFSKNFPIGITDGTVRFYKDPTEEEIIPLLYADDGKVAEW